MICNFVFLGQRWTDHDKALALGIYFRNRHAYAILEHVLTMPSESTLQRFVRGKPAVVGFSDSIFQLLVVKSEVLGKDGAIITRTCDSLNALANEARLQCPPLMKATALRKYVATTSQVLDLGEREMEWLAEHLGYSVDIHKTFYRVMFTTIEKAKIAKLLLLADAGEIDKYSGKTLDELNFEDLALPEDLAKPGSVATYAVPVESDASVADSDYSHETEDELRPRKKQRTEWSAKITEEILSIFKNGLAERRLPRKEKCTAAATQLKKTPQQVKDKVNAMLQTLPRQDKIL